MLNQPARFGRRSIRLKGKDYAQPGAYFVTILVKNRCELFGTIHQGMPELSALGRIAREHWLEIPKHFPWVDIEPFVIMPNHIHGIITIGEDTRKGTTCRALTTRSEQFGQPVHGSIPTIIRSYKSAVTRCASQESDRSNIWHRGYYEHIIRNEIELQKICDYILTNPLNWNDDQLNPNATRYIHSQNWSLLP